MTQEPELKLFLLRHGRAEPAAPTDAGRKLSALGREEIQQVADAHFSLLSGVSKILASPYLRAQQTRDLVAGRLGCAKDTPIGTASALQMHTVDFLTPSANPQKFLDYLGACADQSSILCVSHQPLLGTLLDEICGFEPGQYRMGTGALAYIHFDQIVAKGFGELKWIKHPQPATA